MLTDAADGVGGKFLADTSAVFRGGNVTALWRYNHWEDLTVGDVLVVDTEIATGDFKLLRDPRYYRYNSN